MDMEDDMEVGLVQQFSCLGTTDKEVLVAQLQKLVGPQLNASAAHFFLDMNNWNLQLAIGAYFDLTEDSPPSTQYNSTPQINGASATSQIRCDDEVCWEPERQTNKQIIQLQQNPAPAHSSLSCASLCTTSYSMSVIQDINLTEDTIIPPRTNFLKRWKIHNNGTTAWPPGCHLRVVSGNRSMATEEKVLINPPVIADEIKEVVIEFISPDNPGNYQICWQMSTPEGFLFGDEIWMIVNVGPDISVDLTERLQSLSCDNSRVNFPVQMMSPANGCPSINATMNGTFANASHQDSTSDMS